jgi:acetolactate synthase-1/2/3 large subunit
LTGTVTGAEAFVRMLQLHGVKHVFGLCGDTSLPLYDALYRLDHGIQHVLTRDERSAAYMADGYARVSGRVGVCEGPSGAGQRVDSLSSKKRRSRPRTVRNTSVSSTQ